MKLEKFMTKENIYVKYKIEPILLLILWLFTTFVCIISVVGIIPLVFLYENGWAKKRVKLINKILR